MTTGSPPTEPWQDEHAVLRSEVRRLCSRFESAYWRACDAGHTFPSEFYEALAAGGYVGIAIPEQYGGGGRGITEAAVVLEEIAASGAAMNGASAIHLSIFGMSPVVRHGSEEMRERYLPEVASGRLHLSFGVTEPDAGSDTAAISTVAERVAGGYLVRGRKIWMTKATVSEKVLLLVRTDPAPPQGRRSDGLSLLLADLRSPLVDIRPIDKLGRNAVSSCEVRFDGLFVPSADRVGEEGHGFSYLLDGLNPERILVAAEAVGIGRIALATAATYARERVVFGRPIGQNQGLAFPLADAYARLRAAALAIREAATLYDAGAACGAEANIAKYLAADAGYLAADRALQTLGGMGYAREYDVERYWREARLMRIAPVSQEMVLNYLAEHCLGLPRSY